MISKSERCLFDPESAREKALALILPEGMHFEMLSWCDILRLDKVLYLHLLEFTSSENKISWSDLVSEGFPDLSYSEWYFLSTRTSDICEVYEDPLSRLRSHIDLCSRIIRDSLKGMKHEIEFFRIRPVSDFSSSWIFYSFSSHYFSLFFKRPRFRDEIIDSVFYF